MRSNRIGNVPDERYNLLRTLKQTAEWLLCCGSSNVWNTYGGLSRFSTVVNGILSHGLRCRSSEKYWPFVKDLYGDEIDVSQLRSEDFCVRESHDVGLPLHRAWLEKCLLEHNLSRKVQKLVEDVHRVYLYYEDNAFLRDSSCTKALLTCLKAVEENQPILLTDLDPSLVPLPLDLCQDRLSQRSSRKELCKSASTSNNSIKPLKPTVASPRVSRISPRNNSDSDSEDTSKKVASAQEKNPVCSSILYKSPSLSRRGKRRRGNSRLAEVSSHQRSSSSPMQNGIPTAIDSEQGKMSSQNRNTLPFVCDDQLKALKSLPIDDSSPSAASALAKRSNSCPEISRQSSAVDAPKHSVIEAFKELQTKQHGATLESPSLLNGLDQSQNDMNFHSDSNCDSVYGSFSNIDDSLPPLNADFSDSTASLSCANMGGDCAVTKKVQHFRSMSEDAGGGVRSPDHSDGSSQDSFTCLSLPVVLPEHEERQKKKSIFEGCAITVPTECFFPRPEPGQTLTSFLSTDLNISAELDRENAHFCISEALISAIEQIKCTKTLKFVEEEAESDEEIKKLTQRIRIRRREKLQERAVKTSALLSDGKTDTTTSHSASPMSTSHSSEFGTAESIGSDEDTIEDLELSESTKSNLGSVKENGLSLSMASMYSDADLLRANTYSNQGPAVEEKRPGFDMSSIHLSAEAVALSLLKRFSEKQLPKASDLEWLVSEQDAPQRLLPLPDSWPVSPDDDDDYDLKKTRLRGNLEWAPPRRQIIFIIHPTPRRNDAIAKQNYRCAGCGMKITQNYAKKFRYCEYLGKFFCQCCHGNDMSYIPGRILWKWDFSKYYVSKFAFNLLDQMHCDPLFNVEAINVNLYRKSRQLGLCQEYRQQMLYLRHFIKTCRNTEQIKKELECMPEHILCDPHVYSISDLLQVKNGELAKALGNLVNRCVGHVMKCILCQGKGFICEVCNNERDIIFPFQLAKVSHCGACGSCFHKKCFKTEVCPKCIRIKERKKLQEQAAICSEDET